MDTPFAAHEDDIGSPGIHERLLGGGGADQPAGSVEAVAARGGSPTYTDAVLLRSYYAFAGERAEVIAGGAVRTPRRIRDVVGEFAGIGMNELVFPPTVARFDEIDRLADLVL
jgi:hypothetical protein